MSERVTAEQLAEWRRWIDEVQRIDIAAVPVRPAYIAAMVDACEQLETENTRLIQDAATWRACAETGEWPFEWEVATAQKREIERLRAALAEFANPDAFALQQCEGEDGNSWVWQDDPLIDPREVARAALGEPQS